MNGASLLVDQRSASEIASDPDVKAWALGRRVFVSSLITDMPDERAAVRRAIESIGATPVMFEDLGPQDISAEQAYLAGVRTSAIYVGLWASRYGVRMPDGYSATHSEFLEAERHGLRLCIFTHGEIGPSMDGPQRDLIQGARNLYTTSTWSNVNDLEQRVARRLRSLASEELAPWVRVGRTLFRVREITDDGSTIRLSAGVRSDAVHQELVRLREIRARDVRFASPASALSVQVAQLSTTTRSTVGFDEELTLTAQGQHSLTVRATINDVTPDEMVRRALSDGLFGTALLGRQFFRLSRPMDPFEELRGLNLDDSILRPVARLLFSERLITENAASRIDSFALGPAHQGSRRLRVTWTPPQVWSNRADPEPMSIDGEVTGL